MKLANVVLCEHAEIVDDGVIIRNPFTGAVVPAAARGENNALVVSIDYPLHVVLTLLGGRGTVRIDYTITTPVPDHETVCMGDARFDWPPGETKHYLRFVLDAPIHLPFNGMGAYRLNFLGNGEPLGAFPIAMFWEDEI